jgi:anti-sigma factor RsiW
VNSPRADAFERDQRDLNAYHDGELSGLRRWIFERRLARSPQLRAELEALKRVARWVQQLDAEPPRVDLWQNIAPRLSAVDAQSGKQRRERAEPRKRRAAPRGWREMDWLVAYSRPIAAVAVSAALALALFLGIMEDAAPPIPGMIRWLDTGGRSVMVLEDQGDATIVWLLDVPEEGAPKGGSREAV